MSDTQKGERASSGPPSRPLGIYDRPRTDTITGIEITAIVLSLAWLSGSAVFILAGPEASSEDRLDSLRVVILAMAVILPVAMIWVVAMAARSARVTREESERLQATVDALRHAYFAQSHAGTGAGATLAHRLDELAVAARRIDAMLAALSASSGDTTAQDRALSPSLAAAPVEDQPPLALEPAATELAPPLPVPDFIRALNFPETADDREGFDALRRALKDRAAADLVRAAQDVLTLLSQEGIYMDDLTPDRARPEIWRSFAQGARGKAISSLGGIRDRACLTRAAARMKRDPIFRDAAHHFLRKFDHAFAAFEPTATDTEISALADTRTARAFMLLGRAAGTFD